MNTIRKTSICRYLACVAVAIYALLAYRYGNVYFVGESLWAEDGPVFLQGALDRPIQSFWTSYQGYLHLYPRLFSLLAVQFSITYAPYILFSGWLSAVLILAWSVRMMMPQGLGYFLLAFVCIVASLAQPHSGEAFLSITNAQWWLGSALAIMLTTPEAFGRKSVSLALLIALTGPFSVLLLPVALFQAVKRQSYWVASAISVGACTQIVAFLLGSRESQSLNPDLAGWLVNLLSFFYFGSKVAYVRVLALIFWLALIFLFWKDAGRSRPIILCAAIVYAVSMYAMRGMPQMVSPLGGGSRYFVIPYTLLVVAACMGVVGHRKAGALALFCIGGVYLLGMNKVEQGHVHFAAYGKLAAYEDTLSIPVMPQLEDAAGYAIRVRQANPILQESTDYLPPLVASVGGNYRVASQACATSTSLGLVSVVRREHSGIAKLLWRAEGEQAFHEAHRYFDAGSQRMQIAMDKALGPIEVIFQPQPDGTPAEVSVSYLVCL